MTPASSNDSSQQSSREHEMSAPGVVRELAPGRKLAAEHAILGYIHGIRTFQSVVEFGCGLGTWLGVARALGATETRGYDTAEIPIEARGIAKADFFVTDFARFIKLDRTFDVAICLETADRLASSAAAPLIRTLCSAADWVLFGAAPPFQGGGDQFNENWMEYWAGLFAKEGFLCYDIVRPKFWHDRDIPFYFRQNTCLFVRRGANSALNSRDIEPTACPPTMIHPELLLKLTSWLVNRDEPTTDSRLFAADLAAFYDRAQHLPGPDGKIAPAGSSGAK
jgi:SAM-dependent methyltransferase